MAKITAWLVSFIGVLLVLPLLGVNLDTLLGASITNWLIALSVLVIGVTKLMRNYSKKGRR